MACLVGKVALVTGASSGIGAAIVEQLVNDGMKVVGLARRVERIEELAKNLQGKSGKVYALKADLCKEEDIQNALKWIATNVGPIHVLVNNAGLVRESDFLKLSTPDIKLTFNTNVIALTILSRDVANSMIENKVDGHIVNINSIAGHSVLNFPEVNVYPGTKFAVTALTETLRKELARQGSKIRITSLSPGLVETEIFDSMCDEKKKMLSTFPILKSADVANAVAYAISCPPHVNITELTIQPTGEMF